MVTDQNVGNTEMKRRKHTGREANFELLRLVSMLFVVILHYLSKGQVLPEFTDGYPTENQYLAYLLESIAIVAVNAFLLVSGYFLINGKFRCERVLELMAQVLFYAVLIPVILLLSGVITMDGMNLYSIANDIFPIQTEHYWFATYYIFLYLCTPVLNRGLHQMTKKQHQYLIVFLLIAFSVLKSVIPVPLAIDRKGYDLVWFICVYVLAAYIRLYGIPFYNSMRKSMAVYGLCVLAIFLYGIGIGVVGFSTGKLADQIGEVFHYNHILNIMAAVSFFYIFYHMKVCRKGLGNLICRISPYALGVYLLHEHIEVRYLWPAWFHVKEFSETLWFVPHMVTTVLCIFIIGLMADYLRCKVFRLVIPLFSGGRIDTWLKKIDQEFAE